MRSFLLKILFALVALCFLAKGLNAQTPSEAQVKAAYLYNFAKFIKWPRNTSNDNSTPLTIGVLGQNSFAGKLTPLGSRTVRSRPIEIKYYQTINEIQDCQLLYIDIAEPDELKSILNKLSHMPIVTIGDDKKFASTGGVIQFVTVRGRLRFIINLDVAKNNKIQIDAQLLSLAIEVLGVNK